MIFMNRDDLKAYFEHTAPDEVQKSRMRRNILANKQSGMYVKKPSRRRVWLALPATCLVLALLAFLMLPFGGKTTAYAINVRMDEEGAVFRLADMKGDSEDYGMSVSYVDARPGLEFYIDGKDIAKIEVTTENEYIYAVDWTETQHEKFWNIEYYQKFDEERKVSVADFSRLYDKTLTMTFDENFNSYDQIWYRWTAWDMHKWASENNYSRFLGGHMQLDGYPDHLKEDTITIKITDQEGKQTTKVIKVKVSNNELKQTVVTAELMS